MNAGKLNTRIEIKEMTKTSDGYGGTTSVLNTSATIWGMVREISGDIEQETYNRGRKKEIEIVVRKKTSDDKNINEDMILVIENETGDYRVTSISEYTYKKYIKLTAVRTF